MADVLPVPAFCRSVEEDANDSRSGSSTASSSATCGAHRGVQAAALPCALRQIDGIGARSRHSGSHCRGGGRPARRCAGCLALTLALAVACMQHPCFSLWQVAPWGRGGGRREWTTRSEPERRPITTLLFADQAATSPKGAARAAPEAVAAEVEADEGSIAAADGGASGPQELAATAAAAVAEAMGAVSALAANSSTSTLGLGDAEEQRLGDGEDEEPGLLDTPAAAMAEAVSAVTAMASDGSSSASAVLGFGSPEDALGEEQEDDAAVQLEDVGTSSKRFKFREFAKSMLNKAANKLMGQAEDDQALASLVSGFGKVGDLAFMQRIRALREEVDRSVKEMREVIFSNRESYGVVLHDAAAWSDGEFWTFPVEACLFRRNEGRHIMRLALARKLLLEMKLNVTIMNAAEAQRYEERARLIFRNFVFRGGEWGRRLQVRVGGEAGGQPWVPLAEVTGGNGRVETNFSVPIETAERLAEDGMLLVEAQIPGARKGHLARAWVKLLDEEGLTVISDIDDTVKATDVFLGEDIMMRRTFYEEFRAVHGMAELYQKWATWKPGTHFEFVSNSPTEFFELLRDFCRKEGFPWAPLHLRPLVGPRRKEFKLDRIKELLDRFPKRQVVLVGDSGEHDAATYASIYRQYPSRVEKIIIREVDPSSPADVTVFEGIDESKWQVFTKPGQVDAPYFPDLSFLAWPQEALSTS